MISWLGKVFNIKNKIITDVKIDAEWEQEYEIRKQIREAREASGHEQKTVSMLSGLDQRDIKRVESNADISPNLRTIVKYRNAIGYKLQVVKAD